MAYEGFTGRLSKEKQDLHDIKNSAAEFFRVNRIPQEIERALNELYFHKPEDVHGYLAVAGELSWRLVAGARRLRQPMASEALKTTPFFW
ncbi:enolase 4-like isoform X2 [Micropterus dolomieu]|uniref:enolase 4-like isoform X2 n=1 Tax=Micropterus dolomieu TaxID=147949 RepID=UPI001E8CFD98|nr:enolase 4-like isoform X2 [Micropterus dolomieu]